MNIENELDGTLVSAEEAQKILAKLTKNVPVEVEAKNVVVEDIPVEQPLTPGQFQIKIPIEELRKRSIFLAVPMYGGQCSGMFSRSFGDLAVKCVQYGIQLQVYFLFNESLITRARNYCADEFMRSDRSHLMFIDSDIGFNADDVIALLALQSPNSQDYSVDAEDVNTNVLDDKGEKVFKHVPAHIVKGTPYDIIGAAYPKKCISWEKIKLAFDKGAADANPNNLENFVGDYVFNPKMGGNQIPINQPVEVGELGTGFMMIRRET